MRLKKRVSFIAVMISLFLLCSCDKGGGALKIETSPSDKSSTNSASNDEGGRSLEIETFPSDKRLSDLASKTYDKAQLLEIAKFNGCMNELNANYPIECLRENDGTFRASYLGDGSIAVLLFDDSGNKLSGNVFTTQLLESDFGGLEKGQLIEEVRELDPNGEYLFLYTGRNDTPKVSSHYTKDGYLITIEYDASNAIISIDKELI